MRIFSKKNYAFFIATELFYRNTYNEQVETTYLYVLFACCSLHGKGDSENMFKLDLQNVDIVTCFSMNRMTQSTKFQQTALRPARNGRPRIVCLTPNLVIRVLNARRWMVCLTPTSSSESLMLDTTAWSMMVCVTCGRTV